jgi:DNA-binding NarL/FixJ family response regulator
VRAFPTLDLERRRAETLGIDIEESFRGFLAEFLPHKSEAEIEDIIVRASVDGEILPLPIGYMDDDHEPLTPCEAEVLALVGAGWTNERISAARVVSLETVKSQIKNARLKLGARDRTHAVVLALSLGYIHIEAEAA